MTRTKNTRPRWARPLSAAAWRALCECQNTRRPTLWRLREDAALGLCHWCLSAFRTCRPQEVNDAGEVIGPRLLTLAEHLRRS